MSHVHVQSNGGSDRERRMSSTIDPLFRQNQDLIAAIRVLGHAVKTGSITVSDKKRAGHTWAATSQCVSTGENVLVVRDVGGVQDYR